MLRPRASLDRSSRLRLAAFVAPGLLTLGCVNLTKPDEVQTYCPSGSAPTCVDNFVPPGPDARSKDDAWQSPADTRVGDEPAVSTPDAGPDSAIEQPADAWVGPEASVDTRDAIGPEAKDSSTRDAFVPDTQVPGDVPVDKPIENDVGPDGGSGADMGKDVVLHPDVGPDVGPDVPPDLPVKFDVPNTACPAVNPVTGGQLTFNTTGPVCFVTCDSMEYGWGCSSFSEKDRTVKVNGTSVTCAGALPPKKTPGGYYYFEIGAGGNTWDALHWSGTMATSCPYPAGGFSP
jgi:hypothetical protein